MIVSTMAIRMREIEGDFKKFCYTCNGNRCYIYFRNLCDFLRWFDNITHKAKAYPQYQYEIPNRMDPGEEIALQDIPFDQNFKVKVYYFDPEIHAEVIQ